MVWLYFFFFFSSRRRHTRFDRDWSSDVCSSDLLFCRLVSRDIRRMMSAQCSHLPAWIQSSSYRGSTRTKMLVRPCAACPATARPAFCFVVASLVLGSRSLAHPRFARRLLKNACIPCAQNPAATVLVLKYRRRIRGHNLPCFEPRDC